MEVLHAAERTRVRIMTCVFVCLGDCSQWKDVEVALGERRGWESQTLDRIQTSLHLTSASPADTAVRQLGDFKEGATTSRATAAAIKNTFRQGEKIRDELVERDIYNAGVKLQTPLILLPKQMLFIHSKEHFADLWH